MSNEQVDVARQLQRSIAGNGRLVELLRAAIKCLEVAGLPVTSSYFRHALAEALMDPVQDPDRLCGDDGAVDDVRSAAAAP